MQVLTTHVVSLAGAPQVRHGHTLREQAAIGTPLGQPVEPVALQAPAVLQAAHHLAVQAALLLVHLALAAHLALQVLAAHLALHLAEAY